MRRRDVFLLVGSGVLASSGAQAQAPPTRLGKIGYLHPRTIALDSPTSEGAEGCLGTSWLR